MHTLERKNFTTLDGEDNPDSAYDEQYGEEFARRLQLQGFGNRIFAPGKPHRLVPPVDIEHPWSTSWLDKANKALAYVNNDPTRRHAFTEHDDSIRPGPEFQSRDADAMMRAALAKWPGDQLRVSGSSQFQRECAFAAVRLGLDHLLCDRTLAQGVRAEYEASPEGQAMRARESGTLHGHVDTFTAGLNGPPISTMPKAEATVSTTAFDRSSLTQNSKAFVDRAADFFAQRKAAADAVSERPAVERQ